MSGEWYGNLTGVAEMSGNSGVVFECAGGVVIGFCSWLVVICVAGTEFRQRSEAGGSQLRGSPEMLFWRGRLLGLWGRQERSYSFGLVLFVEVRGWKGQSKSWVGAFATRGVEIAEMTVFAILFVAWELVMRGRFVES